MTNVAEDGVSSPKENEAEAGAVTPETERKILSELEQQLFVSDGDASTATMKDPVNEAGAEEVKQEKMKQEDTVSAAVSISTQQETQPQSTAEAVIAAANREAPTIAFLQTF